MTTRTMPRNWTRALLAALVLPACAAAPAPAPDASWKKETVEKLFTCEVPRDWDAEPLSGDEPGSAFSDGLARISAAYYAAPAGRFATPKAFLRDAESLGGPLKKAALTEVAGGHCERFQRRRQAEHRVKGRKSVEYIYEEFVLKPQAGGFWVLKLSSASRVYRDKPRGLEAWDRFLASFKLLPAKP